MRLVIKILMTLSSHFYPIPGTHVGEEISKNTHGEMDRFTCEEKIKMANSSKKQK